MLPLASIERSALVSLPSKERDKPPAFESSTSNRNTLFCVIAIDLTTRERLIGSSMVVPLADMVVMLGILEVVGVLGVVVEIYEPITLVLWMFQLLL